MEPSGNKSVGFGAQGHRIDLASVLTVSLDLWLMVHKPSVSKPPGDASFSELGWEGWL